jgi:hypothetical protein
MTKTTTTLGRYNVTNEIRTNSYSRFTVRKYELYLLLFSRCKHMGFE